MDPPYTAEDGFLPVSPPAVRRKEDATKIKYAELHSDEIRESADVEKHDAVEDEKQQLERETILGEMKEVLEDERSKSTVRNFNKFGGDGSGSGDFSEPEEAEVRFEQSEIPAKLNQKGVEGLEQMPPSQTEPLQDTSESEEENRMHNCKSDKEKRMLASQVQVKNDSSLVDAAEGGEKTWYFTWR